MVTGLEGWTTASRRFRVTPFAAVIAKMTNERVEKVYGCGGEAVEVRFDLADEQLRAIAYAAAARSRTSATWASSSQWTMSSRCANGQCSWLRGAVRGPRRTSGRTPARGGIMPRVVATYPPPPWRLAGRLLIVVAPVRLQAARSLVPAPLRLLPAWPGRALAMLVLGLYGEGSTLRYGELAGVVGPVLAGPRLGGLVTSIWVDDERSVAGGRELWRLPKQLATLRWRPGAIDAHDAAGAPIAHVRWNEPRVHVPVPVAAPFVGLLDGVVRRAWLAGTLRVAPARIDLDIPDGSPLAPLGLGGHRVGLAGRLDVRAMAARDVATT